jgi:hypothetical protein
MNTRCKIVCPLACQNCGITPCDDRLADQVTEETLNREASRALGGSDGKAPSIFNLWAQPAAGGFDDRTEDVKAAEGLKHCGMRSEFMCRHCHEDNCSVRMAKRTF